MSCTCQDVFKAVCALIGEDSNDSAVDPIKRRIPALIGIASLNLYELERIYRSSVLGEELPSVTSDIFVGIKSLDDPVPLCDRFVPLLALHCAALVVRDENMELSEMLSKDYADACGEIVRAIPASVGKVKNIYE